MNEQQINKIIWYASLDKGGPVYPMTYQNFSKYEFEKRKKPSTSILDFPIAEFEDSARKSYWSYYGRRAEYSKELCQKLLKEISVGIDWAHTKPVKDDSEFYFNSTVHPDEEVPVVKGLLVLKNKSVFPWIANFDTKIGNLHETIQFIDLWKDKDDSFIIELISERYSKALNDMNNFPYNINSANDWD